ncbi:penicillin-binding protein [Wenjunlia vitaminophila]|uniref:Penicillin-binding protein n=1 Tax=Wenjunlia vitaminophila TaxID=76728 RepID=A0A0T6LMJ7_WENVI|nr:transglycosylase domain-containing protein [Wenjunlia vitaminophila]KRV47302.1 penicillin-binding protein [Wenjunlia vitaminophila]
MPSWKLVSGLSLAFVGSLVGAFLIALSLVTVPNEAKAAATQQSNVFYWADGTVMGTKGETNRQIVDLKEISIHMQDAVISAENASFYDDPGVDPKGIARAMFNMATGGDTQGGSTITQQYVKNTYLDQSQTLNRKLKEMFISIKVGTTQQKEEILQGYLNTAWYGRGAYGIQAASQAYYQKDAKDLNANESAFLTSLLKNANLYNPDGGVGASATPEQNRKRVTGRWRDVLNLMVKNGKLEQAEADSYKFPEPKKQQATEGQAGQVGYLMETAENYVLKMAKSGLTKKDLERGGYRIYTTFEKDKVAKLQKAVDKVSKTYLDPKKREKDKYVQVGAASVVPGDGRIIALYGGPGYDKEHFTNNADTRGVPVGSTWKPFVLAAAMEEGTYKTGGQPLSPQSKYLGNDNIKIYDQSGKPVLKKDGTPFYQQNESDYPWGPITLYEAMQHSINTPFVQLGMDVGMEKVKKLAEDSGISEESMSEINASFALGTSTPSAIRMADAYATFADHGRQVEPYSVIKVVKGGEELAGFEKPKTRQAMDSDVADTVTDVLQNVVENGTGTKAKKLGRPAAGKTGTTDKNKSAWFVGYTPELSTAVAMYREKPGEPKLLSMNGTGGFDSIHGGDFPTEVWTEYMKAALKGKPKKDFDKPGPLNEKVANGAGVTSSAPPVKETEDPEPEESQSTPEDTPSTKPSKPNKPSTPPPPSSSCSPTDWNCPPDGDTSGSTNGNTNGNGNGGPGGSTDPSPSDSETIGWIRGQGDTSP